MNAVCAVLGASGSAFLLLSSKVYTAVEQLTEDVFNATDRVLTATEFTLTVTAEAPGRLLLAVLRVVERGEEELVQALKVLGRLGTFVVQCVSVTLVVVVVFVSVVVEFGP